MKNKIVSLNRQPQPKMTVEGLTKFFIESLRCAGRSDKTLISYSTDLAKLSAFYHGPLDGLSPEALEQFFAGHHNLAPATQKRIRSTLSAFLAYCTRRAYLASNPIEKLDHPSFQKDEAVAPKHLTPDQVKAVLRHLSDGSRLAALLCLHGGFRLSEVLSLTLPDLNLDERFLEVTVRHGKGNKRATVTILHPKTIRAIQAHCRRVEREGGIALFSIPPRTLQRHFANAVIKAGLIDANGKPRFSWHALRHTAAVTLLEGNVPIDVVQKHLRHSSVTVTQVYARTSQDRLRQELGRYYAHQ